MKQTKISNLDDLDKLIKAAAEDAKSFDSEELQEKFAGKIRFSTKGHYDPISRLRIRERKLKKLIPKPTIRKLKQLRLKVSPPKVGSANEKRAFEDEPIQSNLPSKEELKKFLKEKQPIDRGTLGKAYDYVMSSHFTPEELYMIYNPEPLMEIPELGSKSSLNSLYNTVVNTTKKVVPKVTKVISVVPQLLNQLANKTLSQNPYSKYSDKDIVEKQLQNIAEYRKKRQSVEPLPLDVAEKKMKIPPRTFNEAKKESYPMLLSLGLLTAGLGTSLLPAAWATIRKRMYPNQQLSESALNKFYKQDIEGNVLSDKAPFSSMKAVKRVAKAQEDLLSSPGSHLRQKNYLGIASKTASSQQEKQAKVNPPNLEQLISPFHDPTMPITSSVGGTTLFGPVLTPGSPEHILGTLTGPSTRAILLGQAGLQANLPKSEIRSKILKPISKYIQNANYLDQLKSFLSENRITGPTTVTSSLIQNLTKDRLRHDLLQTAADLAASNETTAPLLLQQAVTASPVLKPAKGFFGKAMDLLDSAWRFLTLRPATKGGKLSENIDVNMLISNLTKNKPAELEKLVNQLTEFYYPSLKGLYTGSEKKPNLTTLGAMSSPTGAVTQLQRVMMDEMKRPLLDWGPAHDVSYTPDKGLSITPNIIQRFIRSYGTPGTFSINNLVSLGTGLGAAFATDPRWALGSALTGTAFNLPSAIMSGLASYKTYNLLSPESLKDMTASSKFQAPSSSKSKAIMEDLQRHVGKQILESEKKVLKKLDQTNPKHVALNLASASSRLGGKVKKELEKELGRATLSGSFDKMKDALSAAEAMYPSKSLSDYITQFITSPSLHRWKAFLPAAFDVARAFLPLGVYGIRQLASRAGRYSDQLTHYLNEENKIRRGWWPRFTYRNNPEPWLRQEGYPAPWISSELH